MEKSWNCVFEFLWEPCKGSPADSIFQNLLGDDLTHNEQKPPSPSCTQGSQDREAPNSTDLNDVYKDIIGTRCRAPYTHDWGSMSYHNALIVGIEAETDFEIPQVLYDILITVKAVPH